MKIMLMTKSKKYTCKLLEELLKKHIVTAVICKDENVLDGTYMQSLCIENNIKVISDKRMYELLADGGLPECDLVISNTYGKFIRQELIDYVKGNCINLHGAILPDYRGVMAYNFGILNGENQWGVTAHYVNQHFDEGDIIEISKFDINPDTVSVKELEEKSQSYAYELTMKIVDSWEKNGKPASYKQPARGKYYSRKDFERAKKINFEDSAAMVRRKIQAFYCPPYEGAYVEIDGERFELMPHKK